MGFLGASGTCVCGTLARDQAGCVPQKSGFQDRWALANRSLSEPYSRFV